MLSRVLASVALVVLAAVPVSADVVILKGARGKTSFVGIKSTVNGTKITLDNLESFLDKSTGLVVLDGYAKVSILPKPKAHAPRTFPRSEVLAVRYSTEPDTLLNGFDYLNANSLGQALRSFREVLADKTIREVYKAEASFNIGIIYLRAGQLNNAAAWFGKWRYSDSVYTPDVHRRLALIDMRRQKYDDARTEFKAIEALPDIPATWKYKARLGAVQVDIAQRRYADAERKAKAIADQTAGDPEQVDNHVLAVAREARAIIASGNKDRMPEAETLARRGATLKGAGSLSYATIYATLGDALYSQGKLDEARFPYLRVVTLFPSERPQVADCLLNAGQVFLDMAGRAEGAESDDLFVKGMKLLYDCAAGYRGFGAAKTAGRKYLANKARYVKLTKKPEQPADK